MAELNIGQQCFERTCHQLDFLPITCPGCQQVFCRQHSQPSSHDCPAKDGRQLATPSEVPSADSVQTSCDIAECSRHDLVAVLCHHCHKRFCLKHRHAVDHDCPSLLAANETASTKVTVPSLYGTKTSTDKSDAPAKIVKKVGTKSAHTAAKVALMKLKMHAVGDKAIPQMDRVHFNAIPPLGSTQKPVGVFFSNRWAVGRVVDYLAKHWSLSHNPAAASTGGKRLQVYCHNTGDVMEMPVLLRDLSDRLPSGATIILEYASSKDSLPNLDQYRL
ncbi:AN1-type zinc finger protein 1-like isoform X2 [Sycon ciliatum]|uniref:AN1-type zinc finger protein 1-like isoform X2 n=1 Tax=Sycon ciliatum TaxID=27933 RepID=UPI0031F654EB